MTTNPFRSLQRTEAQARFDLLDVKAYDVRLDLAADAERFRSVTTDVHAAGRRRPSST